MKAKGGLAELECLAAWEQNEELDTQDSKLTGSWSKETVAPAGPHRKCFSTLRRPGGLVVNSTQTELHLSSLR